MVDALGLLDGLTATGIILSATIFALLSLYKSIKLKAKLLTFAALTMLFTGFLWLGPFIDLILVTFTGTNITPIYFYSLLSYMWVAPVLIVSMYLGGELLIPKKKWILVGTFIILGIIFEYFLWFYTNDSFTWTLINPGEGLIDASFVRTHPTFLLVALFLLSALIFLGFGFLIKAKQATGELRKKFIYLALGFIIFVVCGALDSILTLPVAIGFVRVVMMTFAIWMYLGLKT
ncbi:MAG: hypothetical protein KGD68_00330 [Candidatus Lokiarchaeota archaeon]|nr:hypothetical protein [Candidatus Lokiarchaeota archaeon]